MKTSSTLIFLFLVICLITSCKKEKSQLPPPSMRTIRLVLYTEKDFSDDDHNISFSAHITNQGGSISFDSTLYTMKVKDIPNKANQLVFEKKVPSDGSILTAGFVYTIENVGQSWHLDTCAANEKLKVIEYPFE